MRNANVKMKDGREYCSPLWEWRPKEGWFSLVGDPLVVIQLADVQTATQMQWRYAAVGYELVDLIEKARDDGWDNYVCEACDIDSPHHGGCENKECTCSLSQCAVERHGMSNPKDL